MAFFHDFSNLCRFQKSVKSNVIIGIYNGKLTGYGPDCPGCSSVGNVSCLTREGANHSLTYDGLYYNDITYGNLIILAADHLLFPCGTVVKVNNGILNEFYGIVLDTGIAMRNAWRKVEISGIKYLIMMLML